MLALPTRSPVFRAALAGLLAILPTTLLLERLQQRLLPAHERYPVPPAGEIASALADKVGLGRSKSRPPAFTDVSQIGYGTATGTLYAALEPRLPFPAWLSGMAYGFLVWVGSQRGWLPAFGLLPPATRPPRRQTMLLMVTHLIWGALTGVLVRSLQRQKLAL
jgi:hypothetical protein